MATPPTRWKTYIDQQHRYPSGLVGRIIGRKMIRQHAPETAWSVELLRLQPADRVLEIGFGAGRGLELALEQVQRGHVTGVDLSPTMLRAAARRNRAAIVGGRLRLLRGDVAALPFEGQHFDKILSIHTLYFWPDHGAICQQLSDLLAPGGRIVSTFATARRQPDGTWSFWELHQQAEALVAKLDRIPGTSATLQRGPDSREYNNVALVIERGPR